ncbi:hypothetical protein HHX47_DHR3000688 [Lentinula edodes]|nr:hypothetical protein HHX47_DHR3000688 [Lentinula edodes]
MPLPSKESLRRRSSEDSVEWFQRRIAAVPGFEVLRAAEIWWDQRYDWLEEKGYMMRPRYRPGWKASWLDKPHSFQCAEDALVLPYRCMDARRTSDSQVVALKRVKSSSDEARISKMFSSQKHAENPANHCIPLLDVLQVPESDEVVLVMPWMCPVNDPPFRTIGEVLQFFQEILQVTVLPL